MLKAQGLNAHFQILGAKDPKHQRGIPLSVIDQWIHSKTVEYLGTTEDVRPYINSADCIVLPSYREGAPHTLLEAASCAKPIIATDVPGCHHVVKDDFNGFLCRLKDAKDLADKMNKMAGMEDATLRRFGENGRKKMEKEYDEAFVINKYLETLEELRKAS
jgi:glycosyltransferase involved in cell wall biosynthesis